LAREVADSLEKHALDKPHLFNRLAIAGAGAGLLETGFVSQIAR
jgi:hypothetical protein